MKTSQRTLRKREAEAERHSVNYRAVHDETGQPTRNCDCGESIKAPNLIALETKVRAHLAPHEKVKSDKLVRDGFERMARVNESLFTSTDAIDEWMARKRLKAEYASLTDQLARARRKGSAKTLIPLDTLEGLLKHHAAAPDRVGPMRGSEEAFNDSLKESLSNPPEGPVRHRGK